MKTITITITLLIFTCNLFSQHQERNKIIGYNILFGGLTAGIGSCINKPKKEKLHKAFLRGFSRGSLGGLINYTGKATASLIWKKESLAWGWPSKLIHTTGVSIIENASTHRGFMEIWHMDFMFMRFELENKKIDWKVKPFTLTAFTYNCFEYNFDFINSLLLGNSLFIGDVNNRPSPKTGARTYIGNIIIFNDDPIYFSDIITHELMHSCQYLEYSLFNDFMPIKYNHIYIDIPYHVFFYNLYKYNSNPFEIGAEYFENN